MLRFQFQRLCQWVFASTQSAPPWTHIFANVIRPFAPSAMDAHTHCDAFNPFSLLNPLLDSFARNSLLSLVLYLDSAYSLLPPNPTHFRSLAPPPGTVLLVLVPDIFPWVLRPCSPRLLGSTSSCSCPLCFRNLHHCALHPLIHTFEPRRRELTLCPLCHER